MHTYTHSDHLRCIIYLLYPKSRCRFIYGDDDDEVIIVWHQLEDIHSRYMLMSRAINHRRITTWDVSGVFDVFVRHRRNSLVYGEELKVPTRREFTFIGNIFFFQSLLIVPLWINVYIKDATMCIAIHFGLRLGMNIAFKKVSRIVSCNDWILWQIIYKKFVLD